MEALLLDSDKDQIIFSSDILHRADTSLQREWLVPNGIGGYASSTISGANTRRYHGLLVAALAAPLGRAVLVSKLEETLVVRQPGGEEQSYELSANLYPGAIHPQGFLWLESWQSLPSPTWRWEPAPGLRLEKRIWMAHGSNVTYSSYQLLSAPEHSSVRIDLVPLVAWRDYHAEMRAYNTELPAEWVGAPTDFAAYRSRHQQTHTPEPANRCRRWRPTDLRGVSSPLPMVLSPSISAGSRARPGV